jgi:hypothetical protein
MPGNVSFFLSLVVDALFIGFQIFWLGVVAVWK